MNDEHGHAARVEAWWSGVGADPGAVTSLRALERGFRAVWARASVTLGDVTLTAIGERVLHDAAERYAFLQALRLDASGISCEDLERDAGSLDPSELAAASRLIVLQLLVVLGRVTGEVLTPALHGALAACNDTDDEERAR